MHDRDSVVHARIDVPSTAWLWTLLVAGVVLRAGVRFADGEDAFLINGYSFYVTLANNLLAGDGLCYAPGVSCAIRMPVYPVFLAGFIRTDLLYPGVVIAQSIMGAAVAWLAWWIGGEMFGPRVGLLAAAATALNPYAVIHDTALQDTALLNLLMVASAALLLQAHRTGRYAGWLAAGSMLGLAILTSARVALFVPFALTWIVMAGRNPLRQRIRTATIVAIPIFVLVGGWTLRNWRVVGAPVLTTEAGEGLYFGNGPLTFLHFPGESIDLTAGEFERLPPEVYQSVERLEGQDVGRDNLLRQMALDYIAANPATVVWGGVRKLWVIFSAQLSPMRGPGVQWAYRIVFLPVHILALAAFWRARADWRIHGLMWALLIAFSITTAVFWAHTSHTSYLHPILFVYASAGVFARSGEPKGSPPPA